MAPSVSSVSKGIWDDMLPVVQNQECMIRKAQQQRDILKEYPCLRHFTFSGIEHLCKPDTHKRQKRDQQPDRNTRGNKDH